MWEEKQIPSPINSQENFRLPTIGRELTVERKPKCKVVLKKQVDYLRKRRRIIRNVDHLLIQKSICRRCFVRKERDHKEKRTKLLC